MVDIEVAGVGLVALVSFVAAVLTVAEYAHHVPRFAAVARDPRRLLAVRTRFSDEYHFRRFWKPMVGERTVVVIPSSDVEVDRTDTQKFDHVGVSELVVELKSHFDGVDLDFVPDDEFGREHRDANVISASGPKPNRVTRHLLNRSNVRFAFDERDDGGIDNAVVDRDTGTRFAPEIDTDESTGENTIRRDYGILTRARSPYDEDRLIVNAAGGYGEGTYAGFQLLADPTLLAELGREGGRYFQALYTVGFDENGTPTTPSLVDDDSVESIVSIDERERRTAVR